MSEGYPEHYILVGRQPFAVDMMTWASWFEKSDNRQIARTVIDAGLNVVVSTVFLGLDHSFGGGESLLFESMTFVPTDRMLLGRLIKRDELWQVPMRRYCTYAQAEAGHAEMVAEVTAWLADVTRRSALPGTETSTMEPKP